MSEHECCGHGDILVGGCWDDEIDLVIREASMTFETCGVITRNQTLCSHVNLSSMLGSFNKTRYHSMINVKNTSTD